MKDGSGCKQISTKNGWKGQRGRGGGGGAIFTKKKLESEMFNNKKSF